MISVSEWVKNPTPKAWFNMLDVVKHVLRGDKDSTPWKAEVPDSGRQYLSELRAAMEKHEKDPGWAYALESRQMKPRLRSKERTGEDGDLDLDMYIAKRDENPSVLPEGIYWTAEKKKVKCEGVTILVELSCPWSEREGSHVKERHKRIYGLVLECERMGIPTRVVGSMKYGSIPEIPGRHVHFYMVIKDWHDPLFPAIWGMFKDNRTLNNTLNVVADFLLGTEDTGNGCAVKYSVAEDIPLSECIIIDPKWITDKGLETIPIPEELKKEEV